MYLGGLGPSSFSTWSRRVLPLRATVGEHTLKPRIGTVVGATNTSSRRARSSSLVESSLLPIAPQYGTRSLGSSRARLEASNHAWKHSGKVRSRSAGRRCGSHWRTLELQGQDLYQFDGFRLTCAQPALQFVNGAAVTDPPADVGLDCQNIRLVVSGGYQDVGATQADELGAFIQDLHDVSSVGTFTSAGTTLSATTVASLLDHVIIVKDAAGIYHKVMIFYIVSDANGNLTDVDGADLAADATGTFAL